jgi:hypothetical protein
MVESRSSGLCVLVLPLILIVAFICTSVTHAEGFSESQGQSSLLNPFGASHGSDMIPLSSGMIAPFLPKIPNLELGYLYSFGNRVSTGRFTADYLLPFNLNADSVLFGEAHAEGWNFWKSPDLGGTTSSASNRVDLSFGGGYRTMLRAGNTLVGVNGFYDLSRLYNRWYSSGGVGLEMAANVAGDDAIDLNFNWYGNLFNRDALVNIFRNKGNSFDLEAGYSHALFDRAMDLRLKFAGYQFDVGNPVYGWRTGADLTTRNGMFTLRYEYGSDRVDGNYSTVGGFVNIGFQLENLLSGESPITLPEPVFKSPRDLRRLLGLKVKRNWRQPEAATQTRQSITAQYVGQAQPLFERKAYVGRQVFAGGGLEFPLDYIISASDLTGVRSVIISWDGPDSPVGSMEVWLSSNTVTSPSCISAVGVYLFGPDDPRNATSDPSFWTQRCGDWLRLRLNIPIPGTYDFGTMTLSFFP